MPFANDLLRDAHHLANRGGRNPKQASLRRAISTAYYAVFHLLISDFVANWALADQRARLGRMFEHRRVRVDVQLRDKNNPTPVESELKKVSSAFAQLQDDRYLADYDTSRDWARVDVEEALSVADEAFRIWGQIRKEKPAKDHLMSMFGARR